MSARTPRRRPRRVEVTAHAKLNLGLVVGPRRPDGFHDLVTVFQSVSLADTLIAERTARGFSLRVRHENVALRGAQAREALAVVTAGPDNLVLRAARLAHERLGLPGGARFTLVKRIPAQAGMGGGSADAAAAILAVARLHGVRLSREKRIELGAEIGSDVPFAITGGTALGTGRGEQLRPLRLARPLRMLVAVPAWRISTADAFRRLDAVKYGLTRRNATLRFATSLGRKRVTPTITTRLGNSFESVLADRETDFQLLCARLRAAGAAQPRLTGSGSGVFGVLPWGQSMRKCTGRFVGGEPLYGVRTVGKGLRIRELR